MLKRAVELEAVEKEVAAVPRMLDIDGLPPSRILQLALVAGIGLMVITAGYGLLSWGLDTDGSEDEDGDGMPDKWELKYSGDPKITAPDGRTKVLTGLDYMSIDSNLDPDNDGLTNLQEYCWPLTVETCTIARAMEDDRGGVTATERLNPHNADSDGDGIPDGIELALCVREMANNSRGDDGICLHFSPVIKMDFDIDGDGWDSNGDGFLSNDEEWNSSEEVQYSQPSEWMTEFDGQWLGGTDPLEPDSDEDGIPDGVEVGWDFNPLAILDGINDTDSDGWNTPLTNHDEWKILQDSARGGLLSISKDSKYAVAREAAAFLNQAPISMSTHSAGSLWLAMSDSLIHMDSNNNTTSFNISGVTSIEIHEGSQSGWIAVIHSGGLAIAETSVDGSVVGDFQQLVNSTVSMMTRLADASGTTRLAFLTSSDILSVLEISDSGDLVTSWNASQVVQDLLIGTDISSMEYSPIDGDAGRFWIGLDSGLLSISSNDLLDSAPLIEWHLGPFSDPSLETPVTSLVTDPDNQGWVMGARGTKLVRITGTEGVHQSLDLNGDDRGDISSLARCGYGVWLWASNEGVWEIDFNKHIDERVSEEPLILSEVSNIIVRNDEVLLSVIPGNYSGIMPIDPRSNDSDNDGWQDGFELMMGTDPTLPSDTFGCNGYAVLCTRAYDDVTYPATHNSHANPESGFNNLAENQLASITTQLERGIRYINMDLYQYGDDVWVCHGEWDLPIHPCLQSGGERAQNQFDEISVFMDANPGAVVTLAFENYVNATVVLGEFDASDLTRFLFSKEDEWPSLGEMVATGKRLVVLADDENQGFSWWHDEHDETRMTDYSYQSDDEFDCDNDRGNDSATMLQIAHYITNPLSSEAQAQLVNQFGSMWQHAQMCIDQHGMNPNFILVDYADYGDAVLIAAVLNGVEDAPPGAFS